MSGGYPAIDMHEVKVYRKMGNSMKKIVFHLNCLEHGGAERVVSTLANQMAQEGYEVIVATQWQGEEEYPLNDNVRRVHVGLLDSDSNRSRIAKVLRRIIYLRKFILAENPDVTIAFARKALYRALMATLFTKQKVIIAVRSDPAGGYSTLVSKIQTFLLFPYASGAVFQTEGQRDFFPKYIGKKSTIILNPINDKYVEADMPQMREKVVVHSGRIVDFKNQDMLIRAFINVHKKHPDFILKLYGGDSGDGTWELLENTIAEFGAGEYVKLMGNSNCLEKDLVNASLFAFSSDNEGLPNALLEAMALGLPVVATDCPCGGPATVIRHGENGLLIPVGDMRAMEESINRLIEEPELADNIAREAKKISNELNSSSIVNQWCDYINQVIARR